MGRYRFLLRPRWLLLHVVAVALAVTMIGLGLWQLGRLDEKRDHNRVLDQRAAAPALEIGAAATGGSALGADDAYRTAAATGTFRPQDEVLVRSRSFEGEPGAWVLTPLELADGRALVVNRGWIPANGPPVLPADAAAPGGQVGVRGLLMPGQHRGRLGPKDPPEGRLPTLARPDLDRLQQQVAVPLEPLYLQLQAQEPPPGDLPVSLPAPERSEGPHLGYAVQWFLFTTIGLIGYGLMIRRTAREPRASDADPGAGPADAGPPAGADGDRADPAEPTAPPATVPRHVS